MSSNLEPLYTGARARMIQPPREWTGYRSAILYIAIAAAIVTFIWLFADFLLRAPEFYLSWDQRLFYDLAIAAQSKVQSILAGEPNSWNLSGWHLAQQYNTLFALPLVPVLTAFGKSWYAYGMAIALIYGTAATLAVSAITAVLLAGYRPLMVYLAFASTALVAVTRTAGWYSTIYYYPDIGDAFVLSLWLIGAILLLRQPTWQRTSVLVLLTVAVILFRRHLLFAWGVIGIGLAISATIEWWTGRQESDPQEKRIRLRTGALRIGHLAASAIIALGVLAIPPRSFLREIVSIALNGAYVDYEQVPSEILVALVGAMGIIPIGLSAAGYIAGAIVFRRRRFEIVGLGLGAVLNIILWITALREIGPQNWVVSGVLFLPLGIGLGVAALAKSVHGRKLATALGAAFLLFLASTGRLIDGAMSNIMDIENPSWPHLLQGRVTKLSVHKGMEEPFRKVFARLGSAGPQPRKILVVASSFTFNDVVLHSAADVMLGEKAKSYFFFGIPGPDSRGKLGVTEIIDADYVLVGNPLQTHLERGFDSLKVVRDMFLDHDNAALDFEQLGEPVAFPGFSVSIYRRIRESDERIALTTLDALEAAVTRRGYGQPPWIEIGRPSRGEPIDARADAIATRNRVSGDGWPARYLSYDKITVGRVELSGSGETTCPQGALLRLRAVRLGDEERQPVATTLLAPLAAHRPFSLAATVPQPGCRLELEIHPSLAEVPCQVTLEGLQLHPGQSVP
jgi:hypothetical protein